MSEIKWSNIESRGVGDVALLMSGARKSTIAAQEQLTGAFDELHANRGEKLANERAANTDYFNDRLAELTTVGDLEANESNINALRDQFDGRNIDQDLIRDGFQDRLTDLRTQDNAERDYNLGVAKAEAQPLADMYKRLVLSGTPEAKKQADQILNDNGELFAEAGLSTSLLEFSDKRGQELITRFRDKKTWDAAEKIRTDKITVDEIVGGQLSQPGTLVENRQAVTSTLAELGMMNSVPTALELMNNKFAAAKGLTPTQVENLARKEGEINARTSGQVAAANADLADFLDDNKVNERYAFTDQDKPDAGFPLEHFLSIGIDNSGEVGEIVADVDFVLKEKYFNTKTGKYAYPEGYSRDMRQAMINELAINMTADTANIFLGWQVADGDINEWKTQRREIARAVVEDWADSNSKLKAVRTMEKDTAAAIAGYQASGKDEYEEALKSMRAVAGNIKSITDAQ